jgi:dolichol-phosphate mannosyltransferase
MDSDLSHDPADLPRLLASDAALVIGSRYVPRGGIDGWGRVRRIASRAGCAYARRVLGTPVRAHRAMPSRSSWPTARCSAG